MFADGNKTIMQTNKNGEKKKKAGAPALARMNENAEEFFVFFLCVERISSWFCMDLSCKNNFLHKLSVRKEEEKEGKKSHAPLPRLGRKEAWRREGMAWIVLFY